MRAVALVLFVAFAAAGCADRPRLDLGEGCDLTTDCVAPLVCRLGLCRHECRDVRDCRPGLACVLDGEFGVCQDMTEADCMLSSDCPAGLVCRFGTCTNECVEDRDCPSGTTCAADMTTGELGCHDPSMTDCRLNSDCPAGSRLVCARDQRCREECRNDRDCRDGRVCNVGSDPNVCDFPGTFDGGPPDGGVDAAVMDGAMPDGGTDGGMAMAPAASSFELGETTACFISGGQLTCFGDNTVGQVGNGSTGGNAPLTQLTTLGSSVGVCTLNARHSCAVNATGLFCWGDDASGQLGTGTGSTATPAAVTGIAGSIAGVTAGPSHTCAWTPSNVYCWGSNAEGQLGDGTTSAHATPEVVPGIGGPVVHMDAGTGHTCAVRMDGTVLCWGDNFYGQLGTGDLADTYYSPTVAGVGPSTEVAVGTGHSCARLLDATMRCWGRNMEGELGDNRTEMSGTVIVRPMVVGMVAQITAASAQTCALETGGDVYCWGQNDSGQIGVLRMIPARVPVPVRVPLPAAAMEVRTGRTFTCARLGATSARCFGLNTNQQYGMALPNPGDHTLTAVSWW